MAVSSRPTRTSRRLNRWLIAIRSKTVARVTVARTYWSESSRALGALVEDLCGLIIQPRRCLRLGASVFHHQLRARRSIGVVDWVSLLPGFKGRTKLGQETPLKKGGKLLVPLGFGLQPLDHGGGVIQAFLIGVGRSSLRLDPKFARSAVQLRLVSSPERCLIAAPGSGNGDHGKNHGLRNLEDRVSAG